MSNFFDDVKLIVSDLKQQPNESNPEILEIEAKKGLIVKIAEIELAEIERMLKDAYAEVGEFSYALFESDRFDGEPEKLGKVKNLRNIIDDKKTRLNEILNRYNEELKALQPKPNEGQGACPNCKAPYTYGEMLFCIKCGGKLPEKASNEDESSSNKSLCQNCKAALVPGSIFCSSCGQKTGANCTNCGSQLKVDAVFCISCGAKVSNSSDQSGISGGNQGSALQNIAGAVGGVASVVSTFTRNDDESQSSGSTLDNVKDIVGGIASIASVFGGNDEEYDDEEDY